MPLKFWELNALCNIHGTVGKSIVKNIAKVVYRPPCLIVYDNNIGASQAVPMVLCVDVQLKDMHTVISVLLYSLGIDGSCM